MITVKEKKKKKKNVYLSGCDCCVIVVLLFEKDEMGRVENQEYYRSQIPLKVKRKKRRIMIL